MVSEWKRIDVDGYPPSFRDSGQSAPVIVSDGTFNRTLLTRCTYYEDENGIEGVEWDWPYVDEKHSPEVAKIHKSVLIFWAELTLPNGEEWYGVKSDGPMDIKSD